LNEFVCSFDYYSDIIHLCLLVLNLVKVMIFALLQVGTVLSLT